MLSLLLIGYCANVGIYVMMLIMDVLNKEYGTKLSFWLCLIIPFGMIVPFIALMREKIIEIKKMLEKL